MSKGQSWPTEERGPTWWDVGRYCEYLAATYYVSVELFIAWPVRRLDGAGYSGFSACTRITGRGKSAERVFGTSERWGQAGAWKTAPAAFHAALRAVEERLERLQAERSEQTTF